jgi:Family of unknown function (DUF5684)
MNSKTIKLLTTGFIASLFTAGSALAQSANDYQVTTTSRGGGIGGIVELLILVVVAIGLWKVFTKAGQPGWASIIPIFNAYIVLKIVGRPWWWLILLIIPFVGFVIAIIVALDLAKSFGKSALFGIGLFFLSFVFVPILGFGDATYKGPSKAV